jgi:purine/pyrimidine-nucleoside phosphorylase
MIIVNEYFEGNVKSISYSRGDNKATVGVMEDGSYTFGTAAPERMTVIQGILEVRLKGQAEYVTYAASESFEIEANSSFEVKSKGQSSYLCEFL